MQPKQAYLIMAYDKFNANADNMYHYFTSVSQIVQFCDCSSKYEWWLHRIVFDSVTMPGHNSNHALLITKGVTFSNDLQVLFLSKNYTKEVQHPLASTRKPPQEY